MEETEKEKARKSFIRWQGRTINQMGCVINRLAVLSTAALGFTLFFIKNDNFVFYGSGKLFFDLAILGFLLSLLAAILLIINRLWDFKLTQKICYVRYKGTKEEREELPCMRHLSREILGKITWKLFWWQIGLFFTGIILLVISIGIIFHAKIF